MTMIEIIRGICRFPQRGATTQSERQASEFVYEVMEKEGFDPHYIEFTTWPHFYLAHALHLGLALLLGLLIRPLPDLALIGGIFLMVSFYGDLTTKWYWLRKLTPKGTSRHVVGSIGPRDAKRILVFSGHHDAGQTAGLFEPEKLRKQTRFWKKTLGTIFPQFVPVFAGIALIAFAGLYTMAYLRIPWVIWSLGMVICGVGLYLNLSFIGKGFAGGASDNASGVASAIEMARRLRDDLPPDTRIDIISFGSEESMMTGSALMVPKIYEGIDPKRIYNINFEGTGGGAMRYGVGEGMLLLFPYDQELVDAAKQVATQPGFSFLTPYQIRSGGTDAIAFVHFGAKAITLLGLDEDDYPPHYHWHTDTPENIDEATLDQSIEVGMKMVEVLRKNWESAT